MTETSNLQAIISKNVEYIKRVMQQCSTESVVGYSMVKHLRRISPTGPFVACKATSLSAGRDARDRRAGCSS